MNTDGVKADAVPLHRSDSPDLPAGDFSAWLTLMDLAILGRGESDVPCGDCTACCRGSYFIEVKPTDADALARIPAELLFPAPGAPPGHQLLGYAEGGSCPLLRADACTIYSDRPATCRTYDCRIFAATGLAEPGPEKAQIMARAGRWLFDYPDDSAVQAQAALKEGVGFLLKHHSALADLLPRNATQLAMLCIRLYPVFERSRQLMASDDTAALAAIRQALVDFTPD